MTGDLGSPLVRAYVRGERCKRAHGPSSRIWRRWIDVVRPRLNRLMSVREIDQALHLVDADRRLRPMGLRFSR